MYALENNVQWTTNLKNAFKHNITRASVIYEDENNQTVTLNENNRLIDLTLTEERYVPSLGIIGSACARKLDVTIQNMDGSINVEDKDLIVKIGADYNNSTYYINYGNFIVYDAPQIDETNGKMTITAYDYMKKFDQPYVDQVNYPCTLLALLQNICTQAGVTLGTIDFANKNFSVEDNQFEGATLREVLMNIAKCAFSWARIGQDNKLYLDFALTSSNTETLTIDDYKTNAFKKSKEYYGPVNRVLYADSDIEGQEEKVEDSQSIQQNGLKELVIYDNLFAYTPEKRQALIAAGTRLLGLTYMPVSQLDAIGFIYLDCNDIINIETLDEQTYTTRVFNHTIKYTGVTSDSIVTEGTSSNEETYKNTAASAFQDHQTRIIVDKANKKINLMVSEVTDHENRITQLQIDVDQISSEVGAIYDLTQTATGSRQVTVQDCLEGYVLEMHIYGNNTVFKYLYPEDDLYPADDLYPQGDSRITVTDANGNPTVYDLRITDVLRANDEVKDEYILKDNYAKVIRRVNPDGTTKVEEEVENIGTYTIYIGAGNNTFRITNYYADLSVQCIVKNSYTDQFVPTIELGTKIIQNQESVKVAWNQISEAIQMMAINGNASLAIIDENGKLMSSFDKTGQHFYDSSENIFGDMGVKTYTEDDGQGGTNTYTYLAFSVPTEYDSYTKNGMAWGIETPDKRFFPIMFVRDFYVAPQQSGAFSGSVELNNCDFVIGATSGITNNSVRITGDVTGELVFESITSGDIQNLLRLYPKNHYEQPYGGMRMLDNILFFKNQAGSNSLLLGDISSNYVLLTDDGDIACNKIVSSDVDCTKLDTSDAKVINDIQCFGNIYCNNGVQPFSLAEKKKNIKKYDKSALKEILNTDIYTYNYKDDKENSKLRVGAIIGDGYNISKEIVGSEGKGIDTYAFTSLCCKAIQEQQAQIEELKKEIKLLKGEK